MILDSSSPIHKLLTAHLPARIHPSLFSAEYAHSCTTVITDNSGILSLFFTVQVFDYNVLVRTISLSVFAVINLFIKKAVHSENRTVVLGHWHQRYYK